VRLLESHARAVVLQGYAQTVEKWLRRLPEEWRVTGPRANLAFGWSLLLRGQLGEIEPYLHDAETAGDSGADAAIRAEALALRAGLTSLRGDPERGCELARAAVALAPADDLYVQSMTAFCLGTACNYAGKDAEAIATYRAALPLCKTVGNRVAATLIVGNLTLLYSARGQLHAAADLCLATLDEAAQAGEQDAPALAVVYGGYGDLLYAWNELDAAQAQVSRVLELSRRSGHVAAQAYGSVVQARLLLARGDLAGAEQALAMASELRRRGMPAWVAPYIVSQQVALALARNDLAAAEEALRQTGIAATDPPHHTREVVHIAHLRLLLHQGRTQDHARLDDADELARRILAAAMRADRMGRVLEVLLLRAQVSHTQGDVDAACDDVMQALTLGESEGYVRIFVNEGEPLRVLLGAVRRRLAQQPAEVGPSPAYVDRLLAAFPQEGWADDSRQRAASGRPVSPPLVEALTERELEVLRLMAEGLTYDEVAQRLIVSLNTVRYHVKGLYGKLGVDKRMAAIEQARVYGLL
jgi:LuxR family maltose regulon positive regulatory protein